MDAERKYCEEEGLRVAIEGGLELDDRHRMANVIYNARLPAVAYIEDLKAHIVRLETELRGRPVAKGAKPAMNSTYDLKNPMVTPTSLAINAIRSLFNLVLREPRVVMLLRDRMTFKIDDKTYVLTLTDGSSGSSARVPDGSDAIDHFG